MNDHGSRYGQAGDGAAGRIKQTETSMDLGSSASENEERDMVDSAAIGTASSVSGQQQSRIRIGWWLAGAVLSLALWFGIYTLVI